MTTRFAGSRSVDERRRRRLAGEVDGCDADYEVVPLHEDDDDNLPEGAATVADELRLGDVRVSHFPISRLISRKLWKLWAVGVIGLLAGVNLLLAGSSITTPGQFGPGFTYLFEIESGRSLNAFAVLLLLASTQLAWFIGWVRSRSPRDFDGRYRVWCWCAIFGLAATLSFTCNLHHAWSLTAGWLWKLNFWKSETLVWLAPVALASLWTLRALHREMRDCWSSLTLLWLATSCGLSLAVLQLDIVKLPLSANEYLLLNWGVELSAFWFLSMSLLLHARHVVHVTPDPAQRRPGLLRLLKLPRLRRSGNPTTASDESESSTETAIPAKKKPKRKTHKPVKPTIANEEVVEPAETVAEEPVNDNDSTDEPDSEPIDAPESLPLNVAEIEELSATEPTEPQPTNGLSKRERRRLRKQQRASKSERKAG